MTKNKAELKPSDYVHLHNHTHYSVLDGLQKIPKMVTQARSLGMEAIAITDHGTLSGAIEFYSAAKDMDVNPIIGMEGYVAARFSAIPEDNLLPPAFRRQWETQWTSSLTSASANPTPKQRMFYCGFVYVTKRMTIPLQ